MCCHFLPKVTVDDKKGRCTAYASALPATVPGHRAGQPPAHAGHTLPPEVLTPDEVHRLPRVPSSRAPTGIRNRALVAVRYRAGLRISEALALERRDINANTGSVTVRHGKGDRHRQVGMDLEAFALLERWLDERRQRGLRRVTVVFCTLKGSSGPAELRPPAPPPPRGQGGHCPDRVNKPVNAVYWRAPSLRRPHARQMLAYGIRILDQAVYARVGVTSRQVRSWIYHLQRGP